jgi:hypothetical protein
VKRIRLEIAFWLTLAAGVGYVFVVVAGWYHSPPLMLAWMAGSYLIFSGLEAPQRMRRLWLAEFIAGCLLMVAWIAGRLIGEG